jgi:hypothetical protein
MIHPRRVVVDLLVSDIDVKGEVSITIALHAFRVPFSRFLFNNLSLLPLRYSAARPHRRGLSEPLYNLESSASGGQRAAPSGT